MGDPCTCYWGAPHGDPCRKKRKRVRTTQEMLDSHLVLVGWRVYIEMPQATKGGPPAPPLRSYAMGNGHWTLDKTRAFLFTDAPNSARKGNDDGLRWARAHARHLIGEHTRKQVHDRCDCEEYDVLKPRIVCIRKRVWPKPPRSAGWPRSHVQGDSDA